MITLRKMTPSEFLNYQEYFIPDYGAEIASNYGVSLAEGLARAATELQDDLPQGVATPHNHLLCLESDAGLAGYLWYATNEEQPSAFIYDFCIFEEMRGRGYGKAAISALEKELAQQGIRQIKLRVAFDNPRARKLYETAGFQITGYNMSKNLPKSN